MTMIPPSPPTPTPQDALDDLLAKHLATALEPQRGRALAAFRHQTLSGVIAATEHSPLRTASSLPAAMGSQVRFESAVISRRSLWYWAGVPSLLAACLALVLTLQFFKSPPIHSGTDSGSAKAAIASEAPSLDQVELSRDVDGGVTLMSDNTPVRVIRHQTLRQMQWTDPQDKATYSVTEPVEKVGYVKIQPY